MLSPCQTNDRVIKASGPLHLIEHKRAIALLMLATHVEAASPHLGDIKASRQHICGDQDLCDACAELIHYPVSQLVVQVSPDAGASVSSLLQLQHTGTMSHHTCDAHASVGEGCLTCPETRPNCEGCTLPLQLRAESIRPAAGGRTKAGAGSAQLHAGCARSPGCAQR